MPKNALHSRRCSDQLEIPSQTAPVGDGHLMPIFLLVPLSKGLRSEELSTRQDLHPEVGRGARARSRLETEAKAVKLEGAAGRTRVSLGARAKPGVGGK